MSHEHKNVPRDRDNSLPIAADTAVARIDRLRKLRMSLADPVFCEDAGSSGDTGGGTT